jgi:FHA domain-containing protein
MKPVESTQNVPSPTAPILERLKAVDVSSLDQLLAIREEQHRIESYRQRADELKDGVSSIVHARVLEDYANRESDLRRRSVPLEQLARTEYRKLRDLLDEAARNEEHATLQKEELEFRHAVGELDESQTADRLKEPLAELERSATDRTALDEHAVRFIQALGREAIASVEPDPPALPDGEGQTAQVRDDTTFGNGAGPKTGITGGASPLSLVGQRQGGSDLTGLGAFSAEELFASEKTMLVTDAARLPVPDDLVLNARGGSLDNGVPAAALLLTELSASPREYRLVAINGIGRSPENQIQVVKPGISRMHAVVNLVNGGFSIKDLDSQNGTFVNGDRVNERLLLDGDLVDVGTVQFVFRLPWPSSAQPTASKATARMGLKR